MTTEYIVWGIPPQNKLFDQEFVGSLKKKIAEWKKETILCSCIGKDPISSKSDAQKIKRYLEKKEGCTAVRIQEIDFRICPSTSWKDGSLINL